MDSMTLLVTETPNERLTPRLYAELSASRCDRLTGSERSLLARLMERNIKDASRQARQAKTRPSK